MIYVERCIGKGRGVLARRKIGRGELIERAPIVVFTREEWELIDKTVLTDYCFNWGDKQGALALGYGSLYNHSYSPNARYRENLPEMAIDFIALRDIEAGEEITVNYNGAPGDRTPVWFNAVD
ncbi:MAG: SET domain-containing protein-lysine N-methyltransferase [Firmicutes bacterium]|nr:SET domain-containing protein-lysine N-methyltransferase [Bacillota bacterium]